MRARQRHIYLGFALVSALVASRAAHAQPFPPGSDWSPLPCRGGVMVDLYQDEAGALGERDIVGDESAPAGFHAADLEFLYVRLRLDDDPAPNGNLRPFSWGMEFDLDEVLSTYEILVIVDGVSGLVAVHQNTSTTLPDDPNDPADEPAVATYGFASNGRATVATGSLYGDNSDYFLDMAIPWADLEPLGLTRSSGVLVWAASSSNSNSLNGDFACHDGATGDPSLSGTASDPTVPDPDVDSDGDGFTDAEEIAAGTDPDDPNSFPASGEGLLEGGGGCSAAGGDAGLALWWLLLAAAAVAFGMRRGDARPSLRFNGPGRRCPGPEGGS